MNILITSIGQRGYLVEHFKESAKGKFGIFAADATKYAPALQNADRAFLLPYAQDPRYYDALLNICMKNDVKGIISINDLELPILAKYKSDLLSHGVEAVISDPRIIDICTDKYKTYRFCQDNEFSAPKTFLWHEIDILMDSLHAGVIDFPILAKPRRGSRSVGVHLLHNRDQLLNSIEIMKHGTIPEENKIMYQEYINSDQYSIHIFNDANCQPISIVTMVNLFRNLGETFQIRTFREKKLIALGIEIGKKLKHYGPLSVDVHKKETGEYVILEFNPRISGCYSLSHYAGADYPDKIFRLISGEKLETDKIDEFRDKLIMLKQFTTSSYTESAIDSKIYRNGPMFEKPWAIDSDISFHKE